MDLGHFAQYSIEIMPFCPIFIHTSYFLIHVLKQCDIEPNKPKGSIHARVRAVFRERPEFGLTIRKKAQNKPPIYKNNPSSYGFGGGRGVNVVVATKFNFPK